MWEKEEGRGAEGPLPGDCSPVPFYCPLGTGTALCLPSCAWVAACAWAPLDEMVVTVFQEGRGSSVAPSVTQLLARGTAPHAPQRLGRGEASRHPAGKVSQHSIGELPITGCCLGPSSSPRSIGRCHLLCMEPQGRRKQRACRPLGCWAGFSLLGVGLMYDFSQHFPVLYVQTYVLCTHTGTYTYSPKKILLVIPGDYSVFFLTVHTDSINHDINTSWSRLSQNISKRCCYLKPLFK